MPFGIPRDPALQWKTPRNHCKLNLCNQIFTHPLNNDITMKAYYVNRNDRLDRHYLFRGAIMKRTLIEFGLDAYSFDVKPQQFIIECHDSRLPADNISQTIRNILQAQGYVCIESTDWFRNGGECGGKVLNFVKSDE